MKRSPSGKPMDALILDLSGLSTAEAVELVWRALLEAGWVKDYPSKTE